MKHMRRHLRIAPYRCNECGKMVNTYASLALHKKKLHGNDKDDPKEKIKPFKCEECGRSFGSKGHLNEHRLGMYLLLFTGVGFRIKICIMFLANTSFFK